MTFNSLNSQVEFDRRVKFSPRTQLAFFSPHKINQRPLLTGGFLKSSIGAR